MSKAVTLTPSPDNLDRLAAEINGYIDQVYDATLQVCLRLAEAKGICRARAVAFEDWAADNINLSYRTARRWAGIGEVPDPAKALEDLRSKDADRKAASRVAGHPATKKPAYITVEPADEDDIDEDGSLARARGFLVRALDAADFALVDNMDGITFSAEMVEAAGKAAQAWSDLADRAARQKGEGTNAR